MRFPEFSGEWTKIKLRDLGSFFSGGTPSSSRKDYYGGEIPFIRSGELHSDSTALSITKEAYDSCSAKMVNKGDLLLALYGATSGDISISRICGAINQAILCIRPQYMDAYFIKSLWEKHKKHILETYLQGGQGNLSSEIIKNISFFFPNSDEQVKISRLIHIIDDRIETQRKIIEEHETLLRSLRHKIYSRVQAQSQCTIADVLCYEQPTKYLVTDTDYTDDDSQVPVLTANKAFILGYTTENFGIYDKGPCIILDDFTLDCKYVDFKFKVKSSAIKILRAKAKTNLRFIFEYFRFLDLNTTEHRRHYIAEIEPMSILLPSNEEIDRIARLFTALDERLEAARKVLKILESQKMYMLQKMFI